MSYIGVKFKINEEDKTREGWKTIKDWKNSYNIGVNLLKI